MTSEAEITFVRKAWRDAINARSAEAFVRCVTEDAVWLPPRGGAIRGREELAAWLKELFEQFEYRFKTSDERLRMVGDDWAVEDAEFRSVLHPRSDEGEPMVHDGRYTIIWRRLDTGEWRIDRYLDRTEGSR